MVDLTVGFLIALMKSNKLGCGPITLRRSDKKSTYDAFSSGSSAETQHHHSGCMNSLFVAISNANAYSKGY